MTSAGKVRRAWTQMIRGVREDHRMMRRYDMRYSAETRERPTSIGSDLVTRIGFQMLAAYRAMRFCVEAEIPVAPRVASRLIRHLYGSDIHWNAELEPGVVLVHGMGLAISHAARVRGGAILFHNVTLGMGVDPKSRATGAPLVERDVHVGPGSTLVGPITIGERSKVTANCLVRSSVPADSLVEAASTRTSARNRAAAASEAGRSRE